jgi:integrase
MPRKGRRHAVERGISRDASGYAVRVSVGSSASRRTRERRFPLLVDLPYLRAQRAQIEADLRAELQERDPPAVRGTWRGDVRTYLARVRARLDRETYGARASELRAWTAIFEDRPRYQLRAADIERAIGVWRQVKVKPKTILNRVGTLKHVYHVLDGQRARTPADDVVVPKAPRVRPRAVDVKVIRTVIARLIRQERRGQLRDAKTRARFLVRVTTGQRPTQIMATVPADVDLNARLWHVPPAKGGDAIPLYLNEEMLVAWRLFVAAKAWGRFDTSAQARVLHRAGWPADLRIYNARHSVGIAFSEGGEDLADIQAWMGHRRIQTTRDFYVPALFSRLKAMSERADGRLGLGPRGARRGGAPGK